MASVQKKGNGWYLQFLHRGKRHTFAVGPVSEQDAAARAARVDELLGLLQEAARQRPRRRRDRRLHPA